MYNFSTAVVFLLIVLGMQQIPYLDFSRAGAGFHGSGRELPEPTDVASVRLGVLGPGHSPEGIQMRVAIQMAVAEANAKGGYQLKLPDPLDTGEQPPADRTSRLIPYEILFRPDDGPWGVAASQVVKFAYEDKVWTIIGGLDGQRTHIAELVVAKAWVPVISPGTTDSTIDYANVPWVFRAVPADNQQCDTLLGYAKMRGYSRLVVISELEREAYANFKRLSESARHKRMSFALHLEYPREEPLLLVPKLKGMECDAIVMLGRADTAIPFIEAMRREGIRAPILASSSLALPELGEYPPKLGELVVVAPYDLSRHDSDLEHFRREFRTQTGTAAGPVAVYSYDVARLVIHAIERAGLNRALIRDELAGSDFKGLAGRYRFSSLGGNITEPILMQLHEEGWKRIQGY